MTPCATTVALSIGGIVLWAGSVPAHAQTAQEDMLADMDERSVSLEIERDVHMGDELGEPPSGDSGQGSGDAGQGSDGGTGDGGAGADSGESSDGTGGIADQIYAAPPSMHTCHDDGQILGSDCVAMMRIFCAGAMSGAMPGGCDEPPEEEVPAPEQPAAEPQPDEPVDEEEPEPLPVVTEADFAELPIEAASVGFEPELQGFGFLDSHTNVFAGSETQVLTEEMLGYQVDIRAIPIEYHFDYGEGSTTSSFEPGAALPDYDSAGYAVDKTDTETATSHVYTATGTYEVTIATDYIGEYRVDGGEWISIPGEATIASSPGSADIWRMSSRSVGGECESQEAWGCNGPVEIEPGDEPPAIFEDQYDQNGNWTG